MGNSDFSLGHAIIKILDNGPELGIGLCLFVIDICLFGLLKVYFHLL